MSMEHASGTSSPEGSDQDAMNETQRLFPSDELLALNHRLAMLRASNYTVSAFAACLGAAREIACTDNNQRQTDMDGVRRFLREDLQLGIDRILNMGSNSRVIADDADIMDALHEFMHLAAGMLKYRQQLSTAVLPELDADLVQVMMSLLATLNCQKPLYERTSDTPLPQQFLAKHDLPAEASSQEECSWVEPRYRNADVLAVDGEDMQEDLEEEIAWFTHLANTFGQLGGFELIIEMMMEPAQVTSFTLLNSASAVLAQICSEASAAAKEELVKVVPAVMQHTFGLINTDSNRLSNYGEDRTYMAYKYLLNTNLPRLVEFCLEHRPEEQEQREAQLRLIRRAFVNKMLDSSTFNKLLSAARECNRLLAETTRCKNQDPEELFKWLQDNQIVQRLLRTGLHHKQYMSEVEGVMTHLTTALQLTEEHLDLMWAVTEKEDAYDAVKSHMFDLLAVVASKCQSSQLDMLFAKLERRQVHNVQDAERLLALLEKLSAGDKQYKMRDKIIQLVWDLTIPADAPPELLGLRTMERVIQSYHSSERFMPDFDNFMWKLITKCFAALWTHQGGQVPLMRTARELIKALPTQPGKHKHVLTSNKCVDQLDTLHKVNTRLVAAVSALVGELRTKVAAAITAAAGGSSSDGSAGGGGGATDAASITAAAMAELGEGSWTYGDIMREYIFTLKLMASYCSDYFPEGLASQLWDALMVDAPTWDHLGAAVNFFKCGIQDTNVSTPYFDKDTQRGLLEKHLVKQSVQDLPLALARLMWEIFAQVNVEIGALATRQHQKGSSFVAQDLSKVIGLDLMWRIFLRNEDDGVADFLRSKMFILHHGKVNPWVEDTPSIRTALVNNLVAHLREAAGQLSAPAGDAAAHAARTVARCLALANEAAYTYETNTMPPVPAHNRAWRGSPVMLELQREGTSRVRVFTHDNEYIGLLRERVARHMACSAKNVRMITMGQELNADWFTVHGSGLRNRVTLNAIESPEPNRFTKAPSEYRPTYERINFTWMFSQADGLYPLLLQFTDAAAASEQIADMALHLLDHLPTFPALSQLLAAALAGPDKRQHLASLLTGSSMAADAGSKQCAPYHTLYGLQALCSLLFPTFDEALLASADRDAAAEGSACPSPAAAAPAAPGAPPLGPNTGAAGAAEAPAAAAAAEAAAVSAVQHQHHREVQQQEFLYSGGLEVFLQAAQCAALSNSTDLQLRRQLSELLVVLLHNLLDAVQGWQSAAFQAAGNGRTAMSGAESGAGQPPGRHAAPASSLVGANGVAAHSVSMPLADPQPAADAAGSSGAAGDSPGGAAPCSKAAATTSDTACHHPASPAMEVSSAQGPPEQQPQQQQQQPSKQRQRGGDLPPVPPGQVASANGNSAAAPGPTLAALFSSDTLKLMGETLLGVAVDISTLWGSTTPGAAMVDDDSSKDVAVAREALQLLQRLLEQHPPLLQPLLLEVRDPPLLSAVLLSPYYSALRRQAAELLERLVSIDSNRAKLLPWLLTQLVNVAQPLAVQWPASCAEFYQLLCKMIARLGQGALVEPEQLFGMAAGMLREQVQALQAMASSAPPQGPLSPNIKQQLRRLRRRKHPVAASLDAADSGDEACAGPEPPLSTLLQGRLQLVLALVRLLDRRAVGSQGQGDLMKLLLQDFLFPEAVAKAAVAAGQLSLARCTASLEPHCCTPSSRRAALELLAELMGDTPFSLEEGVSMLLNLHYQHTMLTKANILPKQLRAPGQYAGLRNGGATCYMNSVFQQLFMQPRIRARILGSAEVPEAEQEDSVFAQLQALFAQLALSKATFGAPNRFWAAFKDYDGTPIDIREHQDAYEFFTRLQDFVDQHLISTNQEPAIKAVMGGTFVQQIICRGHDFTSERNEDFYQISVEVKGMGTLQKSLDDYVKGELMEGDNAYLCEDLGKRVPAVKRTAIRTLPPLLCVHLKRFEFDYHNQTRHKLRDRFEFPMELDMFPYTAEGLAAADAQQKAAEEQQQQGQGGGQPRPVRTSSGAGAAAGQSGLGSNPAYMYDLHGVVVHSGSAFTGHYYSFIKERPGSSSSSSSEAGPRWYLFDDKDVTPWDESSLETECFGGRASQDFDMRGYKPPRNEYERANSAYMLFYEQRAAADGGGAAADGCSTAVAAAAAAAAGDTDVDMDLPLLQTPGAPAVGGAAGGGLSPAQQQQRGLSIPYSMPASLFRAVTEENINLIWQVHVLDKHYFRFVRQLVDSRGDLGQLTTRKSRRRDAGAGAAGAGMALGSSAVPSGSSDRVHSSMACDPPFGGTQQQEQPPAQQCPSSGSGALAPMQVSPSPTPAQSHLHHPPPLDVPGSTSLADLQQSPGPSSRRGEEADAVAQALMRLGVLFQFEVYLYAHESLRSESNVWTEALRSLMGSGSSSTLCMQVFLELVGAHPNWLNTFLLEYNGPIGPSSPQAWVSDMLSWTLQSASKRCGHQLQAYVAACLRHHIILGPEQGPSMGQQQQPGQQAAAAAERALRQALPPLGQALVGVVDQLVQLIHCCLPRFSQGGMMFPREPPTEPARILLAYAESSPWAAAHLLQVFNVVPDLADHLLASMMDCSSLDDQALSEALPLYELLDELLPFASNLPQLIREAQQQAPREAGGCPFPFLRSLPGASGGSPSSSGGGGGGQDGSSGEAGGSNGVHAILPAAGFHKLMVEQHNQLLRGLSLPDVLRASSRAVHLAQMLTWGNMPGIVMLTGEAQRELNAHMSRVFKSGQDSGGGLDIEDWDCVCRCLAAVVLQPDAFLEYRINYCFTGQWTGIDAALPIKDPGLLALYKPSQPVTIPSLGVMRLLGVLARDLHEQQQPQHPAGQRQRAGLVAAHLGRFVMLYFQRLNTDLNALTECGRQAPAIAAVGRFDSLRNVEVPWLLRQGQPLLQQLEPNVLVVLQQFMLATQQVQQQQQQVEEELEQQGDEEVQVEEEEEG